jgi:hypothetical protein
MDRLQPATRVDRVKADSIPKRTWASPVLMAAMLLIILPFVSRTSQAEMIAYDPFNQRVGTISGTASSGGDPEAIWPSGDKWQDQKKHATVEAGSLPYQTLLTQGNHAQVSGASSAFRLLGKTHGAGTNLWLSFLMQQQQQEPATEIKPQGIQLSFFQDNTNTNTPKLFIGHLYNKQPYYAIKDERTTAYPTDWNGGTTANVNNNVHFFVVHLNIPPDASEESTSTSTLTLWVDPDMSSLGTGVEPKGGAKATLELAWSNGGRDLSFNRIRLYNEGTSTVLFDEFRMGDTWADVSPTNATVPEPSSLVLSFLLLGLGAVFGWRRRRRAA